MLKYQLEFILNTYNTGIKEIKDSLENFGQGLEILEIKDDDVSGRGGFKIFIHTQDPTLIFDLCSQFGKIKSVKVDEM
ncbi:MAG: hypothetical protein ABIH18_02705 [Candidatus Omnitrophota bacterium]